MRLVIIFCLFSSFIFGQGILPNQIQTSPYSGGFLRSIDKVWDENEQDSVYIYEHVDSSFLANFMTHTDSIYISGDTIFLRDGSGFVKFKSGYGVDIVTAGDSLTISSDTAEMVTQYDISQMVDKDIDGVTPRLAYWRDGNTITHTSNMAWDSTNMELDLVGRLNLGQSGYPNAIRIGNMAGNANTSNDNIFIGGSAGLVSTGSNNVFQGSYSGFMNTTGFENTGIGTSSLSMNVTGAYNLGIGSDALRGVTGNSNIGIGSATLYSSTSGTENVAIGITAMSQNTGSYSTAVGSGSLFRSNSNNNVAIGWLSQYQNLTGERNTTIGTIAGYGGNNNDADQNVAIGYRAGANMIGDQNVFIGHQSGDLTTGSGNVFIGNYSGYAETGSGKLYITNDNDPTPLIYGDFATDQVTVNGGLTVTDRSGTPSTGAAYDTNGKLVTTGAAVGTVTGTGVATRLAFWSSTSALSSNANAYWDNSNDRLGLMTTAPKSKLQIGTSIIDDGGHSFTTDALTVINQTSSGTAILNDPITVLNLSRQGTASTTYGLGATFDLSRFQNVGASSRTRMDIKLAHNNYLVSAPSVMTMLSSGNIGINNTSPAYALDVTGQAQISNLVGAGTRMVTASSTGLLSTDAIPTGTVTSVGLTAGSGINISGTNPITSSGTMTISGTRLYPWDSGLWVSGDLYLRTNNTGTYPTITYSGGVIYYNLPSASSGQVLKYNGTGWAAGTDNTGTGVTSVTASSPLFSSGGATPNITIQSASGSQNGSLTSSDWTAFNNKMDAFYVAASGTAGVGVVGPLDQLTITAGTGITATRSLRNITVSSTATGTVTSVTGTSPIIITSTPTTTPNVTIQNATTSLTGALTNTDWNTFNNKVGGSGTTNYIPKWSGSSSLSNSVMYESSSLIGIGITTPYSKMHISSGNLGIYNTGGGQIYLGDGNFENSSYYNSAPGIGAVGSAPTSNIAFYRYGGSPNARTEIMRMTDIGLGIFQTAPAYALDVTGDMRVTTLSATPSSIGAWTSGNVATKLTVGTGLSISSGNLINTGVLTEVDGSITNEGYLGIATAGGTKIRGFNSSGTGTGNGVGVTASNGIVVASGGDNSNGGDLTWQLTGQASALHTLSSNGLIARTGSGTVSARTITAGSGISVSNGDGVSGNPTISTLQSEYGEMYDNNTFVTLTTSYASLTNTNTSLSTGWGASSNTGIIVPVAGYYDISFTATVAGGAGAGTALIKILNNGSTITRSNILASYGASEYASISKRVIEYCSASAVISVQGAYDPAGTNCSVGYKSLVIRKL